MEKKIGLLMSVMTSHLSEVNYLSKTKAAGLAQNALARRSRPTCSRPSPPRPCRRDRLASRPGGEGPFPQGKMGGGGRFAPSAEGLGGCEYRGNDSSPAAQDTAVS